jgi:hypothetical protein
MELPDWRLGQ